MSKHISFAEAAALIPDNAVVSVSSSSGLGCPDMMLKAIGERFDETMMNVYHYGYQPIILSTHQFIGFLFTYKSAGQTDGRKCHYPQTGRSDIRPACCPTGRQGKAYHIDDKKRSAYTASTLTGFWKQKSHSSLGHFLYAVQAQLKMPQ